MKRESTPAAHALPTRTQSRQKGMIDSSRWDYYTPRDGDVIVATYPKCGTTWTEYIVVNLLHFGGEVPRVMDVAPWIDLKFRRNEWGIEVPIEEIMAEFDAQTHRRLVKTHLPLDCLPYHREPKYVVVARDARDACLSLFNHRKALGRLEGNDIRAFWREWIAEVVEGTARHPLFDFYQQWWDFQHLDNALLVHFSDLKADPGREIARIAQFIGVEVDEAAIAVVKNATDFSSMKANEKELVPNLVERFNKDGRSFLNKGTNGRWKDELTEEDLSLYGPVAARSASPACVAWIEQGWGQWGNGQL